MVKRLMKIVLVLATICGAQVAPCGGCLSGVEAHAATVQLPATGQTKCYNTDGTDTACPGTGQDGDKKMGVAWDAATRFTDNGNGTVTDNLTGLIWLKDANCFGLRDWPTAINDANTLANGSCGLADGSAAGAWRLPSRRELYSLVDLQHSNPVLPAGHPFSNVQTYYYCSSSTVAYHTNYAWGVGMHDGGVSNGNGKYYGFYVWPVRSGQ